MIARNEARCLARCLESARPHVDELLVVDTGSTDDTPRIALACGARLEQFAWIDDFSAARNFALAQTEAPWRLVLDADEWIEEGGACLREATGASPFIGEVSVRSAFDDGAAVRHAPSWIARFLPRGPQFAGRVHEQIVHALPVRRLPLVVGHDGYRQAQQGAKAGRNERLLRRQLAEEPGNAYLHYQLGKDLQVQDQHAAAAAEFGRARTRLGWPSAAAAGPLTPRPGWLHDLVVRELFCRKRTRDFAAALEFARAEAPWWPESPDFHFAFADLLLDAALAEPQRAAQLLPDMEAHLLRCLELGEKPLLEGAVEGRGSFLAAHNLAVYYDLTGRTADAARLRAGAAVPR